MSKLNYLFGEHPETQWELLHLSYSGDSPDERTTASISPELGCNLLSFQVDGHEYLQDLGAMGGQNMPLGTPILYPMPNRVRDAQFSFDGRTFEFEPNNGTNFLHGLVRDQQWECDEPEIGESSVSVKTWISFEPGSEIYELFPIRNRLELTLTLAPMQLRYDFCVVNEDAEQRLPFGLAIHPFFKIIGPRESVTLKVPAKRWMEHTDLLPSGKLIEMADAPADLRDPKSLAELDLDDVYWGLEESEPQVITYHDIGKVLTLRACDFFTHSVVFTPPGAPFFCVENQSCSTDAHNLYAQGLEEAAHLAVLDPGESFEAWIEFSISDL